MLTTFLDTTKFISQQKARRNKGLEEVSTEVDRQAKLTPPVGEGLGAGGLSNFRDLHRHCSGAVAKTLPRDCLSSQGR